VVEEQVESAEAIAYLSEQCGDRLFPRHIAANGDGPVARTSRGCSDAIQGVRAAAGQNDTPPRIEQRQRAASADAAARAGDERDFLFLAHSRASTTDSANLRHMVPHA